MPDEQNSLGERVLDAVDTLRGKAQFTTLGVANIRHERKSAPEYGKPAWDPYRFSHSYWQHRSINYESELGDLDCHSLFMAVANYIGTRLPEAKPTVSKKNKEGKLEVDPLHDLSQLIRRPNEHYIWANYCMSIAANWLMGDVYFLKDRDVTGQPQRLWHVPSFMMKPRWYGDGRGNPEVPDRTKDGEPSSTYLSHYEYMRPGKTGVLYEAKDVVHLKRGSDVIARGGVNGFKPLVKELYGDDKMGEFTAAIMKNMGIQVPVIRPKDESVTLKADDAAAMKESWMQKTTGGRAGEPVIFTEPVDVEKFGFSPTELDLSKLRLIPESRVAAVLQIPAPTLGLLVGLQNGTSYASSEQARQQGYEEVIIPIQQAIAEEINWQLLPDFEEPGTAEFSFDTTQVRVLQEDQDSKFKREADVLKSGGCTLDEFLTAIGRRPVGAPLGEVRYVPSIVTPMTPERLIATAEGSQEQPQPDPGVADLAKAADVDRLIESLEQQMREFDARTAG